MRRTPLPSAGDLFLAEASGEHVVGKVLWCSPVREHRGAGGFIVLPGVFADPEEVVIGSDDYVPATESVLVIHTSRNLLRKRGWPVIGHLELTARDEELQLYTRGNGLYRGEEYVRHLSEDERVQFFPGLAAGPGAVDYYLQQIIARQRAEGV